MKLKWHGHSCFSFTFDNGTTIVCDPFDDTVGYPLCTQQAEVALLSHDHFDHNHIQSLSGNPQVIRTAGDYLLNGIHIMGMRAFHDDAGGAKRGENVIFVIEGDGLRIAHLGDLGHLPNAIQKKFLSQLDVLLVPIGGTFTITAPQAVELIALVKPRVAIAMHYQTEYCRIGITDETEFVRLTGAKRLGGTLEITPDRLSELPSAIVMTYEPPEAAK